MRLLCTFAGGTGHFLPLLPVARSARARGHEIAFAGQAGMVATVEEAGFPAFDTGGDTLLGATKRIPLRPVDLEDEVRVVREVYAGTVAFERASAVAGLIERWEPDVVLCEEMDCGALVAAERLGALHASVLSIATGAIVAPSVVAGPLDELRAAHGLGADPRVEMRDRHLVLSPFPASLRDPTCPLPPTAHGLRLTSGEAEGTPLPAWVSDLEAGSTVYATFGTVFNLESGDLFERVLAGLRPLGLGVVVTVGRDLDPRALGPQPDTVRVERFVPQAHLLPRCALVVSHAGSGSVVGALAHGLPMLLLPMGADQPFTASRCDDLGVARVLDALTATPDDVRAAAEAVLSGPSYRRNARRVAAEIEALPGPEEAVTLLEGLAAGRGAPAGA